MLRDERPVVGVRVGVGEQRRVKAAPDLRDELAVVVEQLGVTLEVRDQLRAIYGDFGPSRVIYNGSAAPAENERAVEPFVLSAGRLWDEAKNVALLERLAPAVAAPIRVAGAGREQARGIEALGFLPFARMSEQMERAAIWAHPARYEPFGLAVLEAANRNCALVLSDIPTLRESGLPDIQAVPWFAYMAPKGTPQPVVDRMSREIAAVLAEPETKQRLLTAYFDPVGSSPKQLADFMRDELQRWKPVIERAGLKPD